MTAPTVCIVYGFCEGPRLGHKLRRAFTEQGFSFVHDPAQANIIFAHSGGCYAVPAQHRAKLIVLVGLSGKPGLANLRKALLDLHAQRQAHAICQWLTKTWWNAIYLWNMSYNLQMLRGLRQHSQRTLRNVIVIRNHDDPTTPQQLAHFAFDTPAALISMPGQHDDCWDNPTPYVNIVRQYWHGA